MSEHDHHGPWFGIGIAIVLLFAAWYAAFMGTQHQLSVIYDRVAAVQRQLECAPTETFVTDDEGNEYCFAPEPRP